jgi:CubicO group peptidase (beta-lactamase class C family)
MLWARALTLLLVSAVITLACAGRGLARPATPGAADRADAILRRAMADRGVPGLQAAVVLDGRIVFSRSYGVTNLQTPVPVTPTTVFTLNSITKAFTGVAVMQEVEKGQLDLSAPISRYLDDIPQSWGQVTVRQLLGQISGLPDVYDYGDYELTGITDEAKAWAWVVNQPVSPPGVAENYCQTNLALILRILNKLNGRPPTHSAIDEQLARAGTVQTVFGDSRDVIPGKSQPYSRLNSEGKLQNFFEQFPPTMHGGSGLNSTAEDMARWMISVLDGRQLTASSRDVLWTPIALADGRSSSFSLGWAPKHRANYDAVGMEGGARSAFFLYPRYGVGVVILTNLVGAAPEDLTDEVAAAFVPDLKLSGVLKLRAEAEQANFVNLGAMLAAARAKNVGETFDERELENWIAHLLFSKSLTRALQVAQFQTALFPASDRAQEMLARVFIASGRSEDAERAYRLLLARAPNNKAARAYLQKP